MYAKYFSNFVVNWALVAFCSTFQHDAACRVIARLRKERDEARSLLAEAERQMPVAPSTAVSVNASALSNGKRGSFTMVLGWEF